MMNNNCKILDYPVRIESEFITALYPDVEDELKKIFEKSGQKSKFAQQLKQRIKYLEENKEKCILHKEWFENYTDMEWLYSLRVKGQFHNFRMYFIFKDNQAIILHAFLEKRKSDIDKAKKIAFNRRKTLYN